MSSFIADMEHIVITHMLISSHNTEICYIEFCADMEHTGIEMFRYAEHSRFSEYVTGVQQNTQIHRHNT